MDTIRVFLADDHTMIRGGIARALDDADDMQVVGESGDGAGVLAQVAELAPDVILLDYALPDMDGMAVLQKLRQQRVEARVVVLTQHDTARHAQAALDAGASGFLAKSDCLDDLVDAVRAVHRGESTISPSIAQDLEVLRAKPKRKRTGIDSLSARELQLLRHLGAGLTLQQASQAMGDISESTASTYRARLMKKLDLENTAQIIRFALENELVN